MHRVTRRSVPFGFAAALLWAAACSDSTAPEGPLTAEEASQLALQMGTLFSDELTASTASAASAAPNGARVSAIPVPFNVVVNFTVPCPKGGTTRLRVATSGTVDEATKTVIADVTATNRPSNCGLDVHGKTFRITGELTATAHAMVVNDIPVGEQTASVDGGFTWRADGGRHGRCTVSFTASANYTTKIAAVNGNFCGSTVSVTAPITD